MGTHMQGQSYSPIINARMQPGTAKRLRQKSVLGAQVLRTQAVCRHLGEVVASLAEMVRYILQVSWSRSAFQTECI